MRSDVKTALKSSTSGLKEHSRVELASKLHDYGDIRDDVKGSGDRQLYNKTIIYNKPYVEWCQEQYK